MHHYIQRFLKHSTTLLICASIGWLAVDAIGQNATPPSSGPTVRVRGSIVAITATALTVKDRSGEVVELQLADKLLVSEVYPISIADIRAGSFIGTAAMPQADGSQRAIAVTVFPETARGTAEGHRPFDLAANSTMTNATVADVSAISATENAQGDRKLLLKYKDGEKLVVVPASAPIVSFKPGDRSLLVVGASVSLFGQLQNGQPVALRINAGKNGFALPY